MNDVQHPSTSVPIPLNLISPNPNYQPRRQGLSEAHVRLMAESDPATWPPLLVAPEGNGQYVLIDGFHRYEAATRLGLAQVTCIVQDGAGYPDAVAANIAHGLPLSRDDRKDAARWWTDREPNLSYREIGRRVGLSDKTVKRAIEAPDAHRQPTQAASGPVDRWFRATYDLESPPTSKEIQADIATFAAEYQVVVATFYADIGRSLLHAATPYLEGQ